MAQAPARAAAAGPHLYLIDGSGYIFRAYHALPPLTRRRDGLPTGAVAGFCNMLYKLLADSQAGDRPTHLAVVFDAGRRSFRNDLFAEYKAHRPEAPEDLAPQFPLVREAVRAFNLPCLEVPGFEADDVIATLARAARAQGAQVTIVSSDKDLMQLVGDGIDMLDPVKNRRIGPEEVRERFGVGPDQVCDVLALAGDAVDNVPGVPGIGVKTAAELITTYGDLDHLLAHAEEIRQPKRRQNLIDHAERARLSRDLVRLKDDVPLDVDLAALSLHEPDPEQLLPFLKDMEFSALLRRAGARLGFGSDAEAMADAVALARIRQPTTGEAESKAPGGRPGAVSSGWEAPFQREIYETVTDFDALDAWIAAAREEGVLALAVEADGPVALGSDLVGIALAIGPGRACYVPLGHRRPEEESARQDLALEVPVPLPQLPLRAALDRLAPLLADPAVLKIGHNIKADMRVLAACGLTVAPIDDTQLVSYVLNAGTGSHGIEDLCPSLLGHVPLARKELVGSGRARLRFAELAPAAVAAYAAERADIAGRLQLCLKPRLLGQRLVSVYETLDRPLVPVVAAMEAAGIRVDPEQLSRLSGEFAQKMAALEEEIYRLAGQRFNIASTRQLGEVLFDLLGLHGGKRTPTGAQSTGADVLEELAAQGHELPARVLEWRQLAKLKGTYTDALVACIHPETGRVHTTFNLALTLTGRLSSNEPNLQNIPIRTEEGRKIRAAFVAAPGCKLISADYSQIELRLLAEIADIPELKRAFADGLDIHAMTASEIFGVPIAGMDPAVRRSAKTINFGIIYGISPFGLARQLGIGQAEAKRYIDAYFRRFPGILTYMERTKEAARRQGYVTTLFGRRAHLPEINSKNPARRQNIERAAINAPIQGSAADIIRRAMVRVPPALAAAGLEARMVLQVHDELVFEAPAAQVADTIALVKRVMEKAPEPAVRLSLPLVVEAGAGDNWDEAH